MLNHHLRSRVLAHKAPLEAYPQAIHSGRSYQPEWEEELLSLEKVYSYLAQGRWFRSIRINGFFGLGGYQYYLGKHFAKLSVAIRFDPDGMVLICQPECSEETLRLPFQGVTKAELMGGACGTTRLADLSISPPIFVRGLASAECAHNALQMASQAIVK